MQRRNTIQREIVLKAVNALGNHATAEEIFNQIKEEYPNIGKGTVYRNLNILADEGKILKVETAGGADHFDHICRPHYHVQCVCCGRVFDVDMDVLPDLREQIKNKAGFEFLGYDLIFKGKCPDC